MRNEDAGGCSSSGSEGSTEGRPFKKARYVWEVKGKYHLKPQQQQQQQQQQRQDENENKANLIEDNNEEETEIQQPPSCINDSSNKCCVETFLAKSDSFFMNMMDSDDETDESTSKNMDQNLSNEIPITLVAPNPKNQDYYLQRWQSRQMARAYIDNTINNVLESWIVSPPFDATDFVENCDNDGQIEDEGILMAIQSHGLQRNNNVGLSFVKPDELADSTLDNLEQSSEQTNSEPAQQNINSEDCNQLPNFNIEFLDAAVCVAIKRKGLSPYKY